MDIFIQDNRTLKKTYFLKAIDKTNGKELWSQILASQPIYNTLCINRNGDISIATVDGKITCYGK